MAETNEEFTFFWKSHSPFSQWHKSSFTLEDKTFNCAEQYMMYGKAGENILLSYYPISWLGFINRCMLFL